MRTSTNIKTLIAALAITLGLASCSKLDNDFTPVSISGLSLIQASPTTKKLDVYVETKKVDLEDFSFKTKVNYLNAFSGERTISITEKDAATKLKSASILLEVGLGYSVFVVDKFETIDLLALKDDLARPAAGKAKIRFINLSPDGGALDFAISGSQTSLAENKIFKQYSDFLPVDATANASFVVKDHNTGVSLATLADTKIEDGKIYTIYANGLKANTDELKLAATIFTHK